VNDLSHNFDLFGDADLPEMTSAKMLMIMRPAYGGARNRRVAKSIEIGKDGALYTSKEVKPPVLWTRSAHEWEAIEDLFQLLKSADEAGSNFSYGLPANNPAALLPAQIERKSTHIAVNAPSQILVLDIENQPEMPGVENLFDLSLAEVWEYSKQHAPEFVRDADAIIHLSSSHGLRGSERSPRLHAIFILDRPISLEWMKVLAGEHEAIEAVDAAGNKIKHGTIDTSIYEKDRPLWGSPTLGAGVESDPFAERWGIIRGSQSMAQVPALDDLYRLSASQEDRRRTLGVGSRRRKAAAGDDPDGRAWQAGRGWRGAFDELRKSGGHPLWPTVQSSCGSCIRAQGWGAETKAEWVGETASFLRDEMVRFRGETRVEEIVSQLGRMFDDIALEEQHKTKPRLEPRPTPAPGMPIAEARERLSLYVDQIVGGGIDGMQRADRRALAVAMVVEGREEADRQDEKRAEELDRASEAQKQAADARKENRHSDAENLLKRASGLLRAAERRSNRATELRARAEKFGRRAGVIVDLCEPGPDGETETLVEALPRPAGIYPVAPSVGTGKTEAAVRASPKLVAAGARVGYFGGTLNLCDSFEARLRQHTAEIGVNIALASYRGEAADDRNHLPRKMCPRSEDRTRLRRAGLAAGQLCGSKLRGYCRYHEAVAERNGETPCGWRSQRDGLDEADVVTWAGNPLLGKETLSWARRRSKRVTRFDWVQNKTRSIWIDRPDFDFVFIDEPVWDQLLEIETEVVGGAPPVCTRALDGIRHADILRGPATAIAPWWTPGAPAEEQEPDEDGGPGLGARMARNLEALAEATERLCVAAEGHGVIAGYFSYADLHDAVGVAEFARRDRAHEMARMAMEVMVHPKIRGDEDTAPWLASPLGAEYARWNAKCLFIHRLWRAVAKALDRSRNADGARSTAYVKRVDVAGAGEGARRVPGIAARSVTRIQKDWREQTPIMLLDASYDRRLAEPHTGETGAPLHLQASVAPGSCRVTATNTAFTYKSVGDIIGADKLAAAGEGTGKQGDGMRKIAAWLERGAARVLGAGEVVDDDGHRVDALFIGPMAMKDALEDYWARQNSRPAHLDLAYFNSIRGLDCWRGVKFYGQMSRTLPPLSAALDISALLEGEPDGNPAQDYARAVAYWDSPSPEKRWSLKDAWPVVPHNPTAEAVKRAVTDWELIQAVGRLRLSQRPGAGVIIEILGNYPIPGLPVDRIVSLQDLMSVGNDPYLAAAARGLRMKTGTKGGRKILAKVLRTTERAIKRRISPQ
jgi:hypothetical protein